MRFLPLRTSLVVAALLAATSLSAAENVKYSYDPLGRVTKTTTTGGDNDGMGQTITYDAAGNRVTYKVSGSKDRGLYARVIVLPLNGFTIIPLPQ